MKNKKTNRYLYIAALVFFMISILLGVWANVYAPPVNNRLELHSSLSRLALFHALILLSFLASACCSIAALTFSSNTKSSEI